MAKKPSFIDLYRCRAPFRPAAKVQLELPIIQIEKRGIRAFAGRLVISESRFFCKDVWIVPLQLTEDELKRYENQSSSDARNPAPVCVNDPTELSPPCFINLATERVDFVNCETCGSDHDVQIKNHPDGYVVTCKNCDTSRDHEIPQTIIESFDRVMFSATPFQLFLVSRGGKSIANVAKDLDDRLSELKNVFLGEAIAGTASLREDLGAISGCGIFDILAIKAAILAQYIESLLEYRIVSKQFPTMHDAFSILCRIETEGKSFRDVQIDLPIEMQFDFRKGAELSNTVSRTEFYLKSRPAINSGLSQIEAFVRVPEELQSYFEYTKKLEIEFVVESGELTRAEFSLVSKDADFWQIVSTNDLPIPFSNFAKSKNPFEEIQSRLRIYFEPNRNSATYRSVIALYLKLFSYGHESNIDSGDTLSDLSVLRNSVFELNTHANLARSKFSEKANFSKRKKLSKFVEHIDRLQQIITDPVLMDESIENENTVLRMLKNALTELDAARKLYRDDEFRFDVEAWEIELLAKSWRFHGVAIPEERKTSFTEYERSTVKKIHETDPESTFIFTSKESSELKKAVLAHELSSEVSDETIIVRPISGNR